MILHNEVLVKSLESCMDCDITVPDTIFGMMDVECRPGLRVGCAEMEITCKPNHSKNIMELSGSLLEKTGLASDMKINLLAGDSKLCLGPVIGVFVSNGSIRKANAQNPIFRFVELTKANAEANTICYFFSVKDVDFYLRRINGTYFNTESRQWEKKTFPFPDVLYDRGGGTLRSQKKISDSIRESLEENRKLKKINARYFFDKWDVYEKLAQYPEMVAHLPLTVEYHAPSDLMDMVSKYGTVYIKDYCGSNGKGVARVARLEDAAFELRYFHNTLFHKTYNSFDDMANEIEGMFAGKKVIIQEAIDLLQVDNRNVDLRAAVQRDGNGELKVHACPVRLGKEGSPITSTRSGSTVFRLEDFFIKYLNFSLCDLANLRKSINEFLFRSFRLLEEVYGSFGEIGIDFALDKQGKLWFIECNAKPGKDALYLSYDQETIRKSFLDPLEYAKKISGFQSTSE